MDYTNLLDNIEEEVKDLNASYFDIEISNTYFPPSQEDNSLTYANFDSLKKKVKIIETCVLFIDIRKSTKISLKNDSQKMVRLYSSFSRSMIKIAEKTGGKVRNVIGDRVMVVFDTIGCCEKAIETAILMNTVTNKIINKYFKGSSVKCGIGIAFGEMLVTKCGTIKHGAENNHYKYLVWSGKTANIASKLTDSALKRIYKTKTTEGVNVGLHYNSINEWSWIFHTVEELVKKIHFTYSPTMHFNNKYFNTFFATTKTVTQDDYTFPPILMTKKVYENLKIENQYNEHIKRIKYTGRRVSNVDEEVYGLTYLIE